MKIDIKKLRLKKFDSNSKSTFSYWFNHWLAFNIVAINLGIWKPRHLLHDIEKPWLKLFWNYPKVHNWHRLHNKHHIQYKGGIKKVNWEDLIIDNECSRFTKLAAGMSAREYIMYKIYNDPKTLEKERFAYEIYALPKLLELGL